MKVAVYLTDFPPTAGGGYTFQNEIIRSLSDLAEDTHHSFVTFSPCPDIEQASSPACYRPPLLKRVTRSLICMLSGFRKTIEPSAGMEFVWFPSVNHVPVNLPYIATVWDLQHRLQPWFPEVGERGIWEHREATLSRYLQRAAVVIVGSETGRLEIERFYHVPTERIRILPHPTPRLFLEAQPCDGLEVLRKYNLPEEYLFYPAQFWPHKNHANLLLALQVLRQKYNIVFPMVFVGSDQGNEAHVRQLVEKLDLSRQVHFLGFIPESDLIAIYSNAFALTFLTFFGPDNLPPLEAFACGCPVIASNVAGASEQLGDAAILVDPKSPEQIAHAVWSLRQDLCLRTTLIERGRERAPKWTGEDFVRGVFSILDELEPIRRCWS